MGFVIWNHQNPVKMTILENLQNSREFPPEILGTVDSREFPGFREREFPGFREREFPVALFFTVLTDFD